MKKSPYFYELSAAYEAEIDDLFSDSEGKSALKARLQEKRQALKAILPMIEFSPEMVAPVFFDAFAFPNKALCHQLIQAEPNEGDFPEWVTIADHISIADWAKPLVDMVLTDPAGERFMVSVAGLEFIRLYTGASTASAADSEKDSPNRSQNPDDGDDDDTDLAEAGDDWLAEQGFDSFKS